MPELASRVDFNFIRYATCWEDADVLLRGLQLRGGERVLCIASGGDNALALLTAQPQSVLAIDINPTQLYLTELKQRVFQTLDYESLLVFLGVNEATGQERTAYFSAIKPLLSPDAASYWSQQQDLIKNGLVYAGKFENYFRIFRQYLLPLVHGKKQIEQLFVDKTDAEQQAFFRQVWNNRRWQWLMRLFFNRYTLGRYGRDPEFLKQVQVDVAGYIIGKATAHLQSNACTRNYFLHMMLTGRYGCRLPVYLRRENFERIKANAHRLQCRLITAQEAIRQQPFDACGFSNFFEYLSPAEFAEFALQCSRHIPAGARIAYWNLMVPRSLHSLLPDHFRYVAQQEELTKQDCGFFYHRFITDQKL